MKTKIALLLGLVLSGTACRDYNDAGDNNMPGAEIRFDAEIDQVSATRVNDNGFADGDRMGVFIVDFGTDGMPGTLKPEGNRADNVCYTYQRKSNVWDGENIYWKDENTPVDAYGYYPYVEIISDVNAFPFSVALNQNAPETEDSPGGYEASDFLWAKSPGVTPGSVIHLNYKHLMAGVQVTLIEGEGFEDGSWNELDKAVLVEGTVTDSYINMSDGSITLSNDRKRTIIPTESGTDYRAVVIPQKVQPGQVLVSISVGDQTYSYARNDEMTYYSGKLHKYTIKVDNFVSSGEYRFTLIGESITAWENDMVSHEAESYRYLTIDVPSPGLLKEALIESGNNYNTIKNLKLTGVISTSDFEFMRDEMSALEAVNLKEVKIIDAACIYEYNVDDVIPDRAFYNKTTLKHVVFPDKLRMIGISSFKYTQLMGSLTIPEGVTVIGEGAFYGNTTLTGALNLPSTLQEIKGGNEGAFAECGFTGALVFPESLKKIGENAFAGCSEVRGHLKMPVHLTELGGGAFQGMTNIRGDIIIPDGLKKVPYFAFWKSGFDGGLYLPEDLQSIEWNAFGETNITGEIVIPHNISILQSGTFEETKITRVIFPEGLQAIENTCFNGCTMLQDTVKLPPLLKELPDQMFFGCTNLEAVILPADLRTIGQYAFAGCFNMSYLQCLGSTPPYLNSAEGTFDGISKDNFTVVVPADAVSAYRNTSGWNEFKRISAYRDFVCRPGKACAINEGLERELILNADGKWTVERIPDWCHLSQMSGNKKTSLTLTIDKLERGQGDRLDSIVFSLDGGDYTTYCKVSQYDSNLKENESVKLQSATSGKGINLIWVGEGFDARDIANGTYMEKIKEQVEYFFDLEPYKTYRNYFNVYTVVALSQESGIGTLNTLRDVRFKSSLADCKVRLDIYPELVGEYVSKYSGLSNEALSKSVITVCMNTSLYEGVTVMYPEGSAIAYCPHSKEPYPYDARGIVQHEAGGHGFGKLGDEYIYHAAFISTCKCTCCSHLNDLLIDKSYGYAKNLSVNGDYNTNEWKHLIFDDRYSDIVDIFEGGYFHSRGVYRSEENSCMNNNIPYYSTYSRQVIVERIMELAGEMFDFESFVSKDSRKPGSSFVQTSRTDRNSSVSYHHIPPVLMDHNLFSK